MPDPLVLVVYSVLQSLDIKQELLKSIGRRKIQIPQFLALQPEVVTSVQFSLLSHATHLLISLVQNIEGNCRNSSIL